MSNIVQISVLIVAIVIAVLAILAIPILIDLRQIVKKWKKVSEIVELGTLPITWGASFVVSLLKKLIEVGEEKVKEDQNETQ